MVSSVPLRPLGEDEIHLWILALDIPRRGCVEGNNILAPAERSRALQFKSEAARNAFVQRRIAQRMILAEYLGVAAQDIQFTANEYGKPSVIKSQASDGLSFNASHSGAVAAIAVARSGRIGIDVEQVRPIEEAESIARRFFTSNEVAALAALQPSERLQGFYNAWTRKEAVVKALGGGLSIPLDSFEVSLRPGDPPSILRWAIPGTVPVSWHLHHIEPTLGYTGALAIDRMASVSRFERWQR